MKRRAAGVLAGLLLTSAVACTADGASVPAGESRPTQAANSSTPSTGTPTRTNAGYLPDEPLTAVSNALDSVRRAGSGNLLETRHVVAGDTDIFIRVETQFQLSPYLALSRVSITGLGRDLQVTLGQRDGVRMMQAPDEWGDRAGTWYRLYEGSDDFLADQLPSYALTALASAGPPGWMSAGDGYSATVTYDVSVTGEAAAYLLAPELTKAALEAHAADERALAGVAPAKVTVEADGTLRRVVIDASSPAAVAMSELGFTAETFPRPLEVTSTLDVVSLGVPADIRLPSPDAIADLPEAPETLAGLPSV